MVEDRVVLPGVMPLIKINEAAVKIDEVSRGCCNECNVSLIVCSCVEEQQEREDSQ